MTHETWATIMQRDAETRRSEEMRQAAAEASEVFVEVEDGAVVETPEEEAYRHEVAAMVLEAVMPLLAEEIKGNQAESRDGWEAWKASVRPLNDSVLRHVRTIALEHAREGRDWLGRVLNTALAMQTQCRVSMEARSITAAIVNEAWQGIDGWQR